MTHLHQIDDLTESQPVEEILHGIMVRDPFRWLEIQDAADTRRFLNFQADLFTSYLSQCSDVRKGVERDVRELLAAEDMALPISDNRGGLLYLKRPKDGQRWNIYRQTPDGMEDCLISTDMVTAGYDLSLTLIQPSASGRYIVFGIRVGGEDVLELGVYDVDAKALMADRIARGFPRGLMFNASQTGFYYVQEDTEGAYKTRRAVRWHQLHTSQTTDTEIFQAGTDPDLRLILSPSSDRKRLGYLLVMRGQHSRTRLLVQALEGDAKICEIADVSDVVFSPHIGKSHIDIHTTLGAPNGRILRLPLATSERDEWVEVVPERRELISRVESTDNRIVIHYRAGNELTSVVFPTGAAPSEAFGYPSNGTTVLGRVCFAQRRLFYLHSDVDVPPTIYERDLLTGADTLWWRLLLPFTPRGVVCERITFASKDGTQIPITLMRSCDDEPPYPTLLSVYGTSGVSTTPKFSIFATVLLRLGFQCAFAHVRGGGEGGPGWHEAGQGRHKQTAVDDFIGAAEWLISEGLSCPRRLGIAGQSGGTVPILAAITQRPELFRAAAALAPLADMVRFHLFGVARGFTIEFGSPANPEDFSYLFQLSPYHRVRDGLSYPSLLVISGDRDKRCDALHARKMVARLQQANAGPNCILLDYHPLRGHKPALSTENRVHALTNRIAFLVTELGCDKGMKREAI